MSRSIFRMSLTVLATALTVAGLAVATAGRASAQGPCGPGDILAQPYTTSGSAVRTGLGCAINGVSVSWQAFEYNLAGAGPHTVMANTCGDGTDTVLTVHQIAGGAPGAFNPANWAGNIRACDDDSCGVPFNSRVTASGLDPGFYTIVVSNWSSTAQISGTMEVESPTCRRPAPFVEEVPVTVPEDIEAFCYGGPLSISFTIENTGTEDLVGGLFGVNVRRDDARPVFINSIASGSGGPGQIPGIAPLANYQATANLDIPTGGVDTVTVSLSLSLAGRDGVVLFFDTAVFLNDEDADPIIAEFIDEEGTEVFCPKRIDPNAQLGRQVHLPILNFQGQDDVCDSWIEVQNIGCDFAKAALVTWGEPGFCPPQAAGPLKVECTGILKPGSTWNLFGAQVPTGSKGGMLFKFSVKQLSELPAPLAFPPDDITADYLCESLFFGVVGDADDYRRFKKAYNEGLEFDLVPLDRASGEGILAVEVHRSCPGDVTPGVKVTSKYNGIAGTHLGTYDDVFGGYSYYVPLVYADKAGYNTIIYIQNGGLNCSSLEMWFKAQDDCLRAKICDVATLAPGETYQMDASECVGPEFQGSVWIRSSQVMGIAVDIIGKDVLMTYIGEPGEINYTFDPGLSITKNGNQVAFAPLIYSEYQGWDTGIQVQNLSGVTAAKVKVYFLDRSGDIITTLVDWICPRGSQTFFLPVIFDLPGNWVGSARVESQEWFSPGDPLVLPPNIVGVITLIKYNDAARTETTEAIAYNLLPEHKIYKWQIGYAGGGLASGVGLIAIPSVMKDLDNSGLTSEIAIANVVPKPGFTDLVIYFYDQNGLLDYICQKLGSKQVEYIDLQTWGYINPGYKGSAIISAWFWEHDVFDGNGRFVRNLVGLGAVSIERSGTRLGEDAPGDEAAGSRGIPFEPSAVEDDEWEFCFMGFAPLCPGFPDTRGGGDEEVCLPGYEEGPFMNQFGTSTAPVPLFGGGCTPSGTPQAYMIGGLSGDGTPFTGRNCTTGTQTITVAVDQGSCTGGGAGLLLVAYQDLGDPDNPTPFDGAAVCNNIISPLAFAINTVTFTVEPGYWQVLVQTNFIGQTCSNGITGSITIN